MEGRKMDRTDGGGRDRGREERENFPFLGAHALRMRAR